MIHAFSIIGRMLLFGWGLLFIFVALWLFPIWWNIDRYESQRDRGMP